MTTEPLPAAAHADHLTEVLRKSGALGDGRVCDVAVESSRPTIIALTADALEESRTACREAGIAGFLTKPFRREELQTCLERFHP